MDGRNTRGIWSPDGKRIALSSTLGGTDENAFVVSADGSGTAERLTTCDCQSYAAAWSPDGRTILAVENRNAFDIVRIDIDEPHRSIPLLYGKSNEYYPDISPDGRWIAYASDESGQNEVYVQPFPGLGSRHQVSTEGGTSPAWSHDGRELFYLRTGTLGGQASSTKMMVVSTTLGPPFVAGPPRQLFEGRYGATAVIRPYDVTRDGQRFLMVKQRDRAPIVASQMILVQNWFEELKQRVPPK
jgi:dipeptidyl aminopeptidase/acylaminoacyl peptidase